MANFKKLLFVDSEILNSQIDKRGIGFIIDKSNCKIVAVGEQPDPDKKKWVEHVIDLHTFMQFGSEVLAKHTGVSEFINSNRYEGVYCYISTNYHIPTEHSPISFDSGKLLDYETIHKALDILNEFDVD